MDGCNMEGRVDVHAPPCPSYPLFEFLAFTTAVFIEFFKVFNSLLWCSESGFLSLLGLEKEMLGFWQVY